MSGRTVYYAWYELLPAPQQRLNLVIHPGDHISAKVTVQGDTVTLSLSNQTTNQSATQMARLGQPDVSSAEWIAEAPAVETADGVHRVLPLADFRRVSFTNAEATTDGHTGSIADPRWSAQRVDLTPFCTRRLGGGGARWGGALAGQSRGGGAAADGVSPDGSAFSVRYAPARSQPTVASS